MVISFIWTPQQRLQVNFLTIPHSWVQTRPLYHFRFRFYGHKFLILSRPLICFVLHPDRKCLTESKLLSTLGLVFNILHCSSRHCCILNLSKLFQATGVALFQKFDRFCCFFMAAMFLKCCRFSENNFLWIFVVLLWKRRRIAPPPLLAVGNWTCTGSAVCYS